MRDEMANMVWAVESIVPSQTGIGVSGYETGQTNETTAPLTTDDENVKIRYVLGTPSEELDTIHRCSRRGQRQ